MTTPKRDEWGQETARRRANKWIDRSDHTCMFEGRAGCVACQRGRLSITQVYPGDQGWLANSRAKKRAHPK